MRLDIKRPDRIKDYIRQKYGKDAFNKDGTLKIDYLKRAKKKWRKWNIKKAFWFI
jgi:hypothetical protein